MKHGEPSGQEAFQAAYRLFQAACDLAGEERRAFLERECGPDAELRRRVEELLALDDLADEAGAETELPETIGPYRVLSLLGSGGMGVVYEAEQSRPHRRVALKLIRSASTTPEHRARFQHEAQALAWLNHPGIATVYEAGTVDTESGPQPYLAMELVSGERLDVYAERQRLGLRARLALLVRVCDAVHHAHQKGVIHRDLKPANILVEEGGQPRILDFGVARFTDADIEATAGRTLSGQLLGTLPYMSPEQVRADPSQLDTRSDVYALGVLAYELLSGKKPYDVSSAAPHEAARVIVEDEPPRLGVLDRRLRGDVETIVAKAMAKEKERRYDSALQLGRDVRAYLADEPILAQPPTRRYVIGKFARRNKGLVTSVAVILVVLLAGLSVSLRLYVQKEEQRAAAEASREAAMREADAAEAVTDYLVGMFEFANPETFDSGEITAREMLDLGARRLGGELEAQPATRARMLDVFGKIYNRLQLFDRAEPMLREALDLNAERYGEDSLEYAQTLERLAQVHLERGDLDVAERLQRQVLEVRRAELGPSHRLVADALSNLANTLGSTGDVEESERLLRLALEQRWREHERYPIATASALYNLGVLYSYDGRPEKGVPYIEDAFRILREEVGDEHWRTLACRVGLSDTLRTVGRADEALEHGQAAFRGMQSVLGPESLAVIRAGRFVALCLLDLRRPEDALALLDDVLGRHHEHHGPSEELTALLNARGLALHYLERTEEAEAVYRHVLELYDREPMGGEQQVLYTLNNLGILCEEAGRLEEAEHLHREVLDRRRRLLGEGHRETRETMRNLATVYREQGRLEEERALLRAAGTPAGTQE